MKFLLNFLRSLRIRWRLRLLIALVVFISIGGLTWQYMEVKSEYATIGRRGKTLQDDAAGARSDPIQAVLENHARELAREKARALSREIGRIFERDPELHESSRTQLQQLISEERIGTDGWVAIIEPMEGVIHTDKYQSAGAPIRDMDSKLDKLIREKIVPGLKARQNQIVIELDPEDAELWLEKQREESASRAAAAGPSTPTRAAGPDTASNGGEPPDQPSMISIRSPGLSEDNLFAEEVEDTLNNDEMAKRLYLVMVIPGTSLVLAANGVLPAAKNEALDKINRVMTHITNVNEENQTSIQLLEERQKVILLAIAFTLLLLLLWLFLMIERGVFRPINELRNVAEEFRMGSYSSRVPPLPGKEFNELSGAFNAMLDRITKLLESDEDKIRLQQDIIVLLDVVSQASEGDLTSRARVGNEHLGAVAESFNSMLEAIGQLVLKVRSAGIRVHQTCETLREFGDRMVANAAEQSKQTQQVQEEVRAISKGMQKSAEGAGAAAIEAEQTTQMALRGSKAVNDSVDSMHRIRNNVQFTAKKIKSLGEKSIEITSILELINDIAAQTNMLALNASIEASRAGEAGKGFAVVAEEVRKLAERVSLATRDISTFIESIQEESGQAVRSMEEVTGEVERGVRLADEAGKSLQEIGEVVESTSNRIQQIYAESLEQVKVMDKLVRWMERIGELTRSSVTRADALQANVVELVELSDNLNDGIRRFRVADRRAEDTIERRRRKEQMEQSVKTLQTLASVDPKFAPELTRRLRDLVGDLERHARGGGEEQPPAPPAGDA